ncbi:hypothetical protein [Natrinema halophilum]|uniref:Uncharacterized protein n=1 Tax=Natrinema halophilum TaxID=1699371 RepID=A0A7D5GKZ3_9EURY|nr:hypothetical protein [Natrinema halophilum]QLG47333.1 hypothetical protein HYG82_17775 [Natrinema halophilum]
MRISTSAATAQLVTDETRNESGEDRLECDLCGEHVPAAVYHEHLLKECSGS